MRGYENLGKQRVFFGSDTCVILHVFRRHCDGRLILSDGTRVIARPYGYEAIW